MPLTRTRTHAGAVPDLSETVTLNVKVVAVSPAPRGDGPRPDRDAWRRTLPRPAERSRRGAAPSNSSAQERRRGSIQRLAPFDPSQPCLRVVDRTIGPGSPRGQCTQCRRRPVLSLRSQWAISAVHQQCWFPAPGSRWLPSPPATRISGSNAPSGTIRRRITMAMSVEFVLLMGVAAVEGFWPGAGPGGGIAIGFLFLCMLVVPAVMAVISRPFLRDVRRLEEENARLRELYGRARLDAHARRADDARQPSCLPGGAGPPARACRTDWFVDRPAADRRGRPEARQRRARSCQRRRAPRVRRSDGDVIDAAERSCLSRRRR